MENIVAGDVSGNFNFGGNLCLNCKQNRDRAQTSSRPRFPCRRYNLIRDVRVECVLNAVATRSGIAFSRSLRSRTTRTRERSLARRSAIFDFRTFTAAHQLLKHHFGRLLARRLAARVQPRLQPPTENSFVVGGVSTATLSRVAGPTRAPLCTAAEELRDGKMVSRICLPRTPDCEFRPAESHACRQLQSRCPRAFRRQRHALLGTA